MDIAKDNIAQIRKLESIATQLQTRIGQIAASYELEIAILKANLEEARRNMEPEETD